MWFFKWLRQQTADAVTGGIEDAAKAFMGERADVPATLEEFQAALRQTAPVRALAAAEPEDETDKPKPRGRGR